MERTLTARACARHVPCSARGRARAQTDTTAAAAAPAPVVGEKRKADDEAAPALATAGAEAKRAATEDPANRQELLERTLKQVEFYFSDSNISKDKFLRSKTAENDGCTPARVPLRHRTHGHADTFQKGKTTGVGRKPPPGLPFSVLKTFNRVKSITTDDDVLADALLLSKQLLQVSDDRRSVKRALPLPGDLNLDQCTIYAVRLDRRDVERVGEGGGATARQAWRRLSVQACSRSLASPKPADSSRAPISERLSALHDAGRAGGFLWRARRRQGRAHAAFPQQPRV